MEIDKSFLKDVENHSFLLKLVKYYKFIVDKI